MAALDEYTWIFALTIIFSFLTAVGIGANDMANSFATTIGSKALTLGKVVILAGICEFLGAVLLGSGVTSTIKSGVADLSKFQSTPTLLMYGFLCVSVTTSIWDNLAAQLGLPVSMTHTTVGATVGMALTLRGGSGVIWSQEKDEFIYLTGVVPIFLSWICSPIMSGIIASVLYISIRLFILRSEHGFRRAMFVLPVLVGGVFWLIVSFIIITGADNETWRDREDSFAVWNGAVVGVAAALFTLVVVMPLLRARINRIQERADKLTEEHKLDPEALREAMEDDQQGWVERMTAKIPDPIRNNVVTRVLFWNVNQDLFSVAETNSAVKAVHDHAEVFDPKVEALFRYLQVFSAAVMSFTHGANDVSNAMGPFSAVYTIWKTGTIGDDVQVETWILVVGGVGIVVGLAFFSAKVIRCLGVKVCKMTNARGFCAELATAITVAIASRYGLPISTTQTICGALLAIGLMEGLKGVNWPEALRIFSGWVMTLFIACGLCSLFVALGVNSPERRAVDAIQNTAEVYNTTNTAMLTQLYAAPSANDVTAQINALNATFYQVFGPVAAGAQANLNDIIASNLAIFSQFNQTLVVGA